MEELAQSLSQNFSIAKRQDGSFSTDKLHPRFDQFKMKSDPQSQNSRRKAQLERQKVRRYDAQLVARKIAEDKLSDIEDMLVDEREEAREAQVSSYSSSKKEKIPRLMLSEWLVEVPEDFASSCFVVPCPVGKRNLVTSVKGYTTASTKYGVIVQHEIPTALPNAYTILDCIYSPPENKFFCLDVLCWNGHPFLDCETEFRFCWLKSKFEENPQLTERSRFNKSPFERLPFFPCTEEGIVQAICHFPPAKLDGVWFFHKETHYHLAVTPLVGWLKAYMVPEILQVQHIPDEYLRTRGGASGGSTKEGPKRKLPRRTNITLPPDQTSLDAVGVTGLDSNENYWRPVRRSSSEVAAREASDDVTRHSSSPHTLCFDDLLAETVKQQEASSSSRSGEETSNKACEQQTSNFQTESDW